MAPYGSNTVTVRRQCLNSSQSTFEFNDTGGLTERTVFPQCARCLFPHVHGGRYREGVHPKGKTSYPTVALNKKVTRLKLNVREQEWAGSTTSLALYMLSLPLLIHASVFTLRLFIRVCTSQLV